MNIDVQQSVPIQPKMRYTLRVFCFQKLTCVTYRLAQLVSEKIGGPQESTGSASGANGRTDDDGWTTMHYAAMHAQTEVIESRRATARG